MTTTSGDDAGNVVEGVDLDVVASWMDEQGLGSGELTFGESIAGGTQNILLRLTRSGREYVLRRPPPHKRGNSDETMRREARVLAALAGTDVPHPGLIAACPDESLIGAAFYLMEPVDGFNPTLGLPEPHASDPEVQRAMGLSMADAIAALGRVDHVAAGLGDFGKGDGWLERQVERWRGQLRTYEEMEGYTGPDIPGVEEVAAWLDAHRPSEWRAGIIHGDFHFANVLMKRDEGALAAIVDWELATIGDPLLDLGHILSTWPDRENPSPVSGTLAAPHLPTKADLLDRYADGSTRDLSNIGWYEVLACYRLGIILEGTNARADAGKAPRATGDMLHAVTVALFQQALTRINA